MILRKIKTPCTVVEAATKKHFSAADSRSEILSRVAVDGGGYPRNLSIITPVEAQQYTEV